MTFACGGLKIYKIKIDDEMKTIETKNSTLKKYEPIHDLEG